MSDKDVNETGESRVSTSDENLIVTPNAGTTQDTLSDDAVENIVVDDTDTPDVILIEDENPDVELIVLEADAESDADGADTTPTDDEVAETDDEVAESQVFEGPDADEDGYFHLYFHAMSHSNEQLYGNIQIHGKGMFGIARANVIIAESFNVRDVVLLGWNRLSNKDYETLLAPIPVLHEDDEDRYFHIYFHALSDIGGQVHGNIQITNKGMFNLAYNANLIAQEFNVHNPIILGWEEMSYPDYNAFVS